MTNLTHLINKTLKRLRTEGVAQTLRRIVDHVKNTRRERIEQSFDRKYGTDTFGKLERAREKDVVGENWAGGCDYEGIQVGVFRDIVRHLPIRPQDYTFLDFGSGKGRALMMAAEHGFRRVVGVEFSRTLHDVACGNVERFRRTAATASPIELHCEDAVRFEIPDENVVCFFYNPFDCTVMQRVVANMERVYQNGHARILVAYRNPVCAHLLDAASFLKLHYACHRHRIYDSGAARNF